MVQGQNAIPVVSGVLPPGNMLSRLNHGQDHYLDDFSLAPGMMPNILRAVCSN